MEALLAMYGEMMEGLNHCCDTLQPMIGAEAEDNAEAR